MMVQVAGATAAPQGWPTKKGSCRKRGTFVSFPASRIMPGNSSPPPFSPWLQDLDCRITRHLCFLLIPVPCLFDSLLFPNFGLYPATMTQLSSTASAGNRFILGFRSKRVSKVRDTASDWLGSSFRTRLTHRSAGCPCLSSSAEGMGQGITWYKTWPPGQ